MVKTSMTGKQTSSVFEVMKQFFETDGWRFAQVTDKPVLRMSFNGKHISMHCYAEAHDDEELFVFYAVLEDRAPQDKLEEIAEFITRANYGIKLGNFEMDYSDGEIRYKTSLSVQGGVLTTKMVKNQVYANVHTMDKYGPGIMAVLYGDVEPARALARIAG